MTFAAAAPITAILCSEGRDAASLMLRIVRHLSASGVRSAGFIQRDIERPGQCRCDMMLEDLATGAVIAISENRGPEARGCRLDTHALMEAVAATERALLAAPGLLVVNKFGKTEAEGGGFRPVIADAVGRGIPVLTAIPWRNIDGWRRFAGSLAAEHKLADLDVESSAEVLCRRLGLVVTEGEARV